MDIKYLIYCDILGFYDLANEIEEKSGIESRRVRKIFIEDINNIVKEIEKGGNILGKKYGESDDWILITDTLDNVFNIIYQLLNHRNPFYKYGYEKIPLEIGIGTGDYDKWAIFDGRELTIENSTIEFFKTDIINYYHKWYKDHKKQSLKSTYLLFTESAYEKLEPLDKKICKRIEYKHNEKDVKYFVADIDKVQQRGRVLKFIEIIGLAGSKRYDRINDLYIPPLEYEDIVRTLKEKRVVFITGTPEYGKTYTAIRLMWEYYNHGYEPRWVSGKEEIERIKVRDKLEDIRTDLKPGHIIYFEDPFGKTKYERRENLEREIGTIIDSINQVKNAYVLITSREEVFKEFEKEKLSVSNLREFENKINIKKPSYNYTKRVDMLLKWAEKENCKWLRHDNLKNLVIESIKYEKILTTPLSIHSFIIATISTEDSNELTKKIKEKSKEPARVFANEIKNMTDDKILFLSFIFILPHTSIKFIRRVYQELVDELGLESAKEFDSIIKWFKDDKIEIEHEEFLKFSHPSYSQSLEHILIEDIHITKIFSKLLFKLSEKDATAGDVAYAVAKKFDKLPENVRNDLLLKLSEKDATAERVAIAVADNFDKLPENVRNDLLFKLSEKDATAERVAIAVAKNFDKLPENVRNDLLLKLSEKDATAWYVAIAVANNFDKLPENVRNLLFKLSEKNATAQFVAKAVADNFDKLPENVRNDLLFKLSEKDATAGRVAIAVADNFDKLPENVRNDLLLKLSEKDATAQYVIFAVVNKFDKLPENVRNLLFKLSEKDATAGTVAFAVVNNFDKLPENVRNDLLFKLSEKDATTQYVARAVADNFDKLPENVRNDLLFKLSKKDATAQYVARAVADNFDKLPENVRNLLFKLSEKDSTAGNVAIAVANNFDKLPENVRNLLFKLSEKDATAQYVAYAIAKNAGKLPENVRNLFFKLTEKDATD